MNNNIELYFFTEKLNDLTTNNILKFKKICIIYKPTDINNINHIDILNIKIFCKRNKILFFVSDNLKLSLKYKADGIFLSSWNKQILNLHNYKKSFYIIGSAHNISEYFFKIRQKCQTIMLSPIFYNKKYTKSKILEVIKFNLITLNWKIKICALGGINLKNLKRIKTTKASSVAFISLLHSHNLKSLPMISMGRLFKT
jgi:thiamine monophosphate synthase